MIATSFVRFAPSLRLALRWSFVLLVAVAVVFALVAPVVALDRLAASSQYDPDVVSVFAFLVLVGPSLDLAVWIVCHSFAFAARVGLFPSLRGCKAFRFRRPLATLLFSFFKDFTEN